MRKICALILVFIVISQAEANVIRVGVAEFVDRRANNAPLQTDMTEIFTGVMSSYSDNIEVAASKSFQAINLDTTIKSGKTANCKYMILGALMNEDTAFSTIDKPGLLYSTPVATVQTQTMNIAVRLIEVDTGKIIFSASGTGSGSLTHSIKEEMKMSGTKEGMQQSMKDFEKCRKQAFKSASSMAAEKICAFLTGEYPKVTSVKVAIKSKRVKKKNSDSDTVIINKGTQSGVSEKTFYRIFYESKFAYENEKFTLAVAEVSSMKTNNCIANITGGNANNIRTGDNAEQITPEEAAEIIEQNNFVQKRSTQI